MRLSNKSTWDSFLFGVAIAVIVLSLSPDQPPRQLVTLHDPGGSVRTYALQLDDPRLGRFREAHARWYGLWPNKAQAIAQWSKEIAEHYAERLPAGQRDGVQVSLASHVAQNRNMAPVEPTNLWRPEHRQFWLTVSSRQERFLQAQHRKYQLRRETSAAAPIVIGPVTELGPAWAGVLVSLVAGCLAALIASVWCWKVPALEIGATDGQRGAVDDDEAVRLELPRQWVRVRQRPAVLARSAILCGLVLVAILRSITLL